MAEMRTCDLASVMAECRWATAARAAGLGRVLLGLAEFGHGGGQGDELGDERDGHQRSVAGQVPG
jgi:hypothetical protein